MPRHSPRSETAVAPKAQPKSAAEKAMDKLGLHRPIDFALHLPIRYEDETKIKKLEDVLDGEHAQIEGEITSCEIAYRPRRQLVAILNDGTDSCQLRFFNFYPSQQKQLAVGTKIRARGELRGGMFGWQIVHPVCKAAGSALPVSLTPVYSTVAGLPQPYLRKAVVNGMAKAEASGALQETIPAQILSKISDSPTWNLREALSFLHYPAPDVTLAQFEDHTHPAWQRLKIEELLAQQLSQLTSRKERDALLAPALKALKSGLHEKLLASLPFALTNAQRRVSEEIAQDLQQTRPMHRLLQGDVGSGKTIVAALAAAICVDAGQQCALMVPTEILAEQHFRKLVVLLEPLFEPLNLKVAWLTGSQTAKQRREALALIESGQAALVVGTHAIIQDKVIFNNLALAIVDEQHRFGVAQRLALRAKMNSVGHEPHLLMMTATPIPRTLAMSYYADLNVSTIDELPPGRTPILTKVLSDARKAQVIDRIEDQIKQGRQVYWVCPLIEESEMLDLSNATQTHQDLVQAFPGMLIGLLHSRMPPAEKKAVMQLFSGGEMKLLVSTTVIEVGVDVPNASLMVIEHAERFGLSQLHQLRGRVGRGAAASACVLLYSLGESGRLGDMAKARLKAMAETNDGFEIARLDLEIRGPGEFLGARQSGAALLRFADLLQDAALLERVRAVAPEMLREHADLAALHVERWMGGKVDFLKA
ncbi:MAG: ATP-dependent DNA helicase RecG [Brachymonas sp.]